MKIKSFMIAAMAAAFGLASCAKDDAGVKIEDGNKATLSIKFKQPTRSFDDGAGTNTQNGIDLTNATIFVFDGAGEVTASKHVTSFETTTFDNENDGITTGNVNKVVVIGNAGDLSAKTSMTELRKEVKTLNEANTALSVPTIWVYGEVSSFTWGDKDEDGVQTASVSIDMAPILSRIDVTVDISGITAGIDEDDPSVAFNGVALLYSSSHSTLVKPFAPSIAELSAFDNSAKPLYSGLINTGYPLWSGMSDKVALFGDSENDNIMFGDWDTNLEDKKFTRTFYAFAPDITAYGRNAIVTVFGDLFTYKYEVDEIEGTKELLETTTTKLFWPVHFNTNETASNAEEMVAGKYYQMTIAMTGDFTKAPIITHPEHTVNEGILNVTINTPKWEVHPVIESEFKGGE